ncbi:hypothetical protein [Methylobacterium oryzisoli]|uniref:hypothetical protein n=1 Tax=Methylobacterium oryzisoli TaxID=3385502 RepID=UPI0038917089
MDDLPSALAITDHALLRWMERRHGIDVEMWRRLMADELRASLDAYEGECETGRPCFVITHQGRVVTVLGDVAWMTRRLSAPAVPVPIVTPLAAE